MSNEDYVNPARWSRAISYETPTTRCWAAGQLFQLDVTETINWHTCERLLREFHSLVHPNRGRVGWGMLTCWRETQEEMWGRKS